MSSAPPLLSLDLTPVANGCAGGDTPTDNPALIPNGGGHAVVPRSPEAPVANGHATPAQESPFTGYIIAMHRKMVRTLFLWGKSQTWK